MPISGRRSPPLDVAALDLPTVRELARVIGERLDAVEAFGGSCPGCRNAELRAFLARLRAVLDGPGPAFALPDHCDHIHAGFYAY